MKYQIIHGIDPTSKNPLEIDINDLFSYEKIRKQALKDLFFLMMYDGHKEERENLLRYLDLYFGYSKFFRKETLKVARAHEAARCKYSLSTTDRNRALAKELGLVEIANSKQEDERHKNKISETNISRFKEILKEFKKYIPKKYALLCFVLTSLGLTNINGDEHINTKMNNKKVSITSKSNSKLIPEENSIKRINDHLFLKNNEIGNEMHTTTTSIPRDKCLEWMPSKLFPHKRAIESATAEVGSDYCPANEYEIYQAYQSEDFKKWVRHINWEIGNGKEAQRKKRITAVRKAKELDTYRMKKQQPKNKKLLEITSKLEVSDAFLRNFAKMKKGA